MQATVVSVSKDRAHRFSKAPASSITLLEGIGVEGDSHAGETVQHLSRIEVDSNVPNLRQVHLIHCEIIEELKEKGFDLKPADLGENITTTGLDLLGLPKGTILNIGNEASVEITGLRNPCFQIEKFRPGMLKELLRKKQDGTIEKRCGIMGVVIKGGTIFPGDNIEVVMPTGEKAPLAGV